MVSEISDCSIMPALAQRDSTAVSVGENAVHGSDSDENARIEGDFFFSAFERI